jgi:phosphonate transport system substrate-binding protein
MKRPITCLVGIVLISALILSSVSCMGQRKNLDNKGTEKNPIIMGFNPAESAEAIMLNADLLSKEIEKQTGLKIKTFVAGSYSALVVAMKSDYVDIAWLPSFAFVQAEEVADAEVLLKAVRNGEPFYYGAIVVRKDSPIQTVEDLKGKSIAWASETSTSGRIFPLAALINMGIDPDTYFSKEVVAGGHDSALLAVYHGKVDAAATFSSDAEGTTGSWTQMLDEDKKDEIRAIFVTDPIPADTMSTSKKFHEKNPEALAKIVEVVKNLNQTEDGRKLLKDLYNIEGMVDAVSADYDPVRDAAKLLGIDIEGKKKDDKPLEKIEVPKETPVVPEEKKEDTKEKSDEKQG